MESEWIPIKEAAKLLEVSERQVLNRIHTSKLKANAKVVYGLFIAHYLSL